VHDRLYPRVVRLAGLSVIAISIDHPLRYPWGLATLLAPVLIYWFLVRVTGIPTLEAQMLRSRGHRYRDHQPRTNTFFHCPRTRQWCHELRGNDGCEWGVSHYRMGWPSRSGGISGKQWPRHRRPKN
jgi:hypothetical protein